MVFNQQTEVDVRTADGTSLEVVKDFKYLGAWIKSSEQDIKTRKALAWMACNKLTKIWKSHLPRQIKVKLFHATVESILLYGSETWTVTTKIRKLLDGCYTRLLRSALDISWRTHTTNKKLYGELPKVTDKIRKRRLQFAGHCLRSTGQVGSDLVLWRPSHGKRSVGQPSKTYVDLLCEDTGQEPNEIRSCMQDRHI
ncbi:uncharacterized protein [Amphiura filiformis]|uniref:uncharacterized protein n=1 Tax=Amphiura filiformis TaxID=82378 RepID=UPI003B223A99